MIRKINKNKNRIFKVKKLQVVLFFKGGGITTFEKISSIKNIDTSILNLFNEIVEECKKESLEWSSISIRYGSKGISFTNNKTN